MRKLVKIKFSTFSRLTHLGFVAKANIIYNQLDANNAVFGLTPAELTALSTAVESLSALTLEAAGETGSKVIRDARDNQAAIVLNLLIQYGINKVLALACTKPTYDEQKAIVSLAGYPIGNDTNNPVPLERVTDVELESSGTPGASMVYVKWKRNKAAAYIVQVASGTTYGQDTIWTDKAFCTTSKYELSLPAGTWNIRVVAVAGIERAEASVPVAIVVG